MHSRCARALIAGLLVVGCGAFPSSSATAANLHFAQTAANLDFAHMWTPQTGHTDAFFFDPITTPGALHLSIHSDALGVLDLNDTLFVANDTMYSEEAPGRTKFQLSAPHPVLGGHSGDTVWILPVDFTEFSPGYDRKQPEVSSANGWSDQTLVLSSVTAPTPTARFAVWTSTGTVRFASTGNTTTPQTWNTGSPAHGHMNWGFTEPGLYVFSFAGSITGPVGTLTSPTYTVALCVIGQQGADASALQATCGITPPGGGDDGSPPEESRRSVAISAMIASCGLAMSVAATTATLTPTVVTLLAS